MADLMREFRGAYASAKLAKDKKTMKREARRWHAGTSGLAYWFDRSSRRAAWGSIATGEGPFTLVDIAEAKAEAKAKAQAQAEKDKAEAAEFKRAQAEAAVRSWGEASYEAQLGQLVAMIESSGRADQLTTGLSAWLRERAEAQADALAKAEAQAEIKQAKRAQAQAKRAKAQAQAKRAQAEAQAEAQAA
jgi:hypothetical protein